jgi:hypothetical protein
VTGGPRTGVPSVLFNPVQVTTLLSSLQQLSGTNAFPGKNIIINHKTKTKKNADRNIDSP